MFNLYINSVLVALQMPEGLLLYACTIADIVQKFGFFSLNNKIGIFPFKNWL